MNSFEQIEEAFKHNENGLKLEAKNAIMEELESKVQGAKEKVVDAMAEQQRVAVEVLDGVLGRIQEVKASQITTDG